MQAQSRNRKRAAPAPGASSSAQQEAAIQQPFQYSTLQDSPFNNDSLGSYRNPLPSEAAAAASYDDFNPLDPNFYNTALNSAQPQTFSTNVAAPAPPNPSTQLVRRDTNQQLTTRTPQRVPWATFNQTLPSENRVWENMEEEDEQDIDTKAAIAKKDAQAKRKQIPPFVQKLSSFLDSSNNTDLIRWSDDGNSFIVLDEDEFARTLIPELFKHNNYASFVRQLNMYGFHKKVGLNANSMKAAEKKVKDPNVYWHEYFKRGRPDLLWLIQKPQNKTNAKRKRGDDKREQGDSDDEIRRTSPELVDNSNNNLARPHPGGQNEMVSIPQSEMHTVRSELQRLQRQQGVISKMIAQLKEQNEQFYRQATAFQALHDRHENSINAILTFLATFYNRSLDGQNPQNLVNMFQNSIPQNTQQHGSVVDVGDLPDTNMDNNQQLQRYPKRPLALLLPPPVAGSTPSTNPASARSSLSPSQPPQPRSSPLVNMPIHQPQRLQQPQKTQQQQQQLHHQQQQHQQQQQNQNHHPHQQPQQNQLRQQQQQHHQQPQSSATPNIKDDAETPNYLGQLPENDDMISLLNNVNASNSASPNPPGGSNFDFSSALDHFQTANGASPLTQQQRDNMLSLIAQQGQPATSQPGANNALVAPNPPPMPSLDQLQRTQEQLDMLTRLQQEQDSKVADLAGRLQPLSPSGTIPGVGADTEMGAPGDFDINAFINSDDNYFSHFPGNAATNHDVGVGMPAIPSTTAASNDVHTSNNPNTVTMAPDLDFSNLGDSNGWTFDDADHALGDGEDLFGEFDDTDGVATNGPDSRDEEEEEDGGGRIVGSVASDETSPARVQGDDGGGVGGEGVALSVEGDTPGKRRRLQR